MLTFNPARLKDRVTLTTYLPIVGSKYKGPALFLDTPNQEYWEVMPKFSADEEKLQRALLLDKVVDKRKVVAYNEHFVMIVVPTNEPLEQPKAIESPPTWRQAGFGFGTVAATASSD